MLCKRHEALAKICWALLGLALDASGDSATDHRFEASLDDRLGIGRRSGSQRATGARRRTRTVLATDLANWGVGCAFRTSCAPGWTDETRPLGVRRVGYPQNQPPLSGSGRNSGCAGRTAGTGRDIHEKARVR